MKFVSVYFSNSIGGQSTTEGGWDTHGFNNTRMFPIIEDYHLPMTDQTLPTLLTDLDERGLLDETLVVWMGEFGRTPKINRHDQPRPLARLLHGADGRRRLEARVCLRRVGQERGSLPGRDPVRPEDLAATMFHLLGIDPQTEIRDKLNRPLPIAAGSPMLDLIA